MKFNKLLFTFTIMLCIAVQSFGKTVDENTARTIGANFLLSKGVALGGAAITTAYTATGYIHGTAVAAYYVFNVTGQRAFVMVSADDIIIPILAYSDESSFDFDHLSPSTKDWIDGYKNQVIAAITYHVPARSTTAGSWSELLAGIPSDRNARTTSVAALLGSLAWDQSPGFSDPLGFYNDSCPGPDAYNKAPTGCVATAMAQVMKFWNWPSVGTGNYSYLCTTYSAAPLPLSANFGNTAYGWGTMQTPMENSTDPTLAQLMFHAGVSVSMQYDTTESGAYVLETESYPYTQSAEYALKTYFHYKRSLHGYTRNGIGGDNIDTIAEATWDSMLVTELGAGRPIIYDGQGPVGGHCWVLDGWSTGNLFHFNWGWSGASNGYYTVDNLAPPALGVGGGAGNFNQDQGVIMGIEPDSFPNTPGNIQLLAHLNSPTITPMNYGKPITISTKILNSNTTSFSGDFAMWVYDTANHYVGTIQTISGQTIAAGDSTSLTFGPSILYAMVPMDYYHIQAMYRHSGASTWTPVANNGMFINYTTADVSNDTDVTLDTNIVITSSLPLNSGSPLSLKTQFINYSTMDFTGTLQAVMINVSTGTSYLVDSIRGQNIVQDSTTGIYVPLTATFTNSAFTAPNGLYALVIQHEYNGMGGFYTTSSTQYENPVLIWVGPYTPPASTTSLSASNDVYVYPNPAKDKITIMPDGVNITAVRMFDIQGRELQKQIQPNGSSAITVPVNDLAPGVYIIHMQTDAQTITKKIIITQ